MLMCAKNILNRNSMLKINKGYFLMTNNRFLEYKDWGFPVPIFYGPGRISDIGSICKNLEIQNPLIVTDKGSASYHLLRN